MNPQGTKPGAPPSNQYRELAEDRVVRFAHAALSGLTANGSYDPEAIARKAVDIALQLNRELEKRDL